MKERICGGRWRATDKGKKVGERTFGTCSRTKSNFGPTAKLSYFLRNIVSLPNCRHFGQLGTACTKPAKISDTNYKITLLSNDRRIRKVRNVLSLQCVVTRAPNLLYGVRLYALQGVVTAAQLDKMYEEQTRNAFYRIDAN